MPDIGLLLLAAAASAAPEDARRRRALAGVALIGLARASLDVAGGTAWPQAGLASSYLAYTAGIALLGYWLLLVSLLWGARAPNGSRQLLVWGAALLALGAGLMDERELVRAAGAYPAVLHALGLGIVGALLRRVGRLLRLSSLLTWPDRWLDPARPGENPLTPAAGMLAAQVLALLVALLAPQVVVVLLGLVLAALLEWAALRRLSSPARRAPGTLLACLALIALGAAVMQVLGAPDYQVAALPDAPFSEAFEILVAGLMGAIAWVMLGLWPWHRRPVVLGPLVGALLLFRVASDGTPGGMEHWQPIFYGAVLLGAIHAAAAARDDVMLLALGALGLLSGDPAGSGAGLVLVALAVGGSILGARAGGPALLRHGGALSFLLGATVAVGAGSRSLQAGLGAETVYSVLTLLMVVVLLLSDRPTISR